MHTISEPYDEDDHDYFGRLSIFETDRFSLIVNNPNNLQSTDYFFTLSDGNVTRVDTDRMTTVGSDGVHLGVPTRKHNQDFGYDSSHII